MVLVSEHSCIRLDYVPSIALGGCKDRSPQRALLRHSFFATVMAQTLNLIDHFSTIWVLVNAAEDDCSLASICTLEGDLNSGDGGDRQKGTLSFNEAWERIGTVRNLRALKNRASGPEEPKKLENELQAGELGCSVLLWFAKCASTCSEAALCLLRLLDQCWMRNHCHADFRIR